MGVWVQSACPERRGDGRTCQCPTEGSSLILPASVAALALVLAVRWPPFVVTILPEVLCAVIRDGTTPNECEVVVVVVDVVVNAEMVTPLDVKTALDHTRVCDFSRDLSGHVRFHSCGTRYTTAHTWVQPRASRHTSSTDWVCADSRVKGTVAVCGRGLALKVFERGRKGNGEWG
jgi:hypothetical protein